MNGRGSFTIREGDEVSRGGPILLRGEGMGEVEAGDGGFSDTRVG